MTAFPAALFYTSDDAQDEGTVRTGLDDQLAATRQLVGAAGIEDITIASGSITPTRGTVRVEGQGAAADDLVTIVTTNLPDGSLLLLSIKDEGHTITVKHGTGAGNTSLAGGLDFAMNKLEQALFLQRRGTLWYEYARFGREKVHVVGAGGEPAFQNSWGASAYGVRFWKDADGLVNLSGDALKASFSASSSLVFTLPAGYRPAYGFYAPISCTVGGTDFETNLCEVQTDGDVYWVRSTATVSQSVLVMGFDTVRFRAAA